MWLLSTVHGQAEGVCETRREPRHVQGLLPLSDFSLFFSFFCFLAIRWATPKPASSPVLLG